MSDNFLIVRNSINTALLEKTKLNYSLQVIVDGKGGIYGQKLLTQLFVEDRLQNTYKYVCLVDEDCVLYDLKYLGNIISYMSTNGVDIMGVPDGSVLNHRKHRPDVPNLFFTVIDTTKLKEINLDELKNYRVPVGECTPEYAYDDFEPYYKTLCYMNEKLNYVFSPLEAKTIIDDITTEVYFNNLPICLHTWYARKYNKDAFQTKRIDKAIAYGLSQQTLS